jgi:hypothetical protein
MIALARSLHAGAGAGAANLIPGVRAAQSHEGHTTRHATSKLWDAIRRRNPVTFYTTRRRVAWAPLRLPARLFRKPPPPAQWTRALSPGGGGAGQRERDELAWAHKSAPPVHKSIDCERRAGRGRHGRAGLGRRRMQANNRRRNQSISVSAGPRSAGRKEEGRPNGPAARPRRAQDRPIKTDELTTRQLFRRVCAVHNVRYAMQIRRSRHTRAHSTRTDDELCARTLKSGRGAWGRRRPDSYCE